MEKWGQTIFPKVVSGKGEGCLRALRRLAGFAAQAAAENGLQKKGRGLEEPETALWLRRWRCSLMKFSLFCQRRRF